MSDEKFLSALDGVEDKLIETSKQQVGSILNKLYPRMKLAALEDKSKTVTINFEVTYYLNNTDKPHAELTGSVSFPPTEEKETLQV